MNPLLRRSACSLLLASGLALAGTTETVPVQWFADDSDSGGRSHLTRLEPMVLLTLEAEGLVPGDAYTLWWVVFNNPAGCVDGCDADDLVPGGAALPAVGNASGNVAKADGTLEFGARLPVGSNTPGHQVLFGADGTPEGAMLLSSEDAEIHLVVQSHGQARGGKRLQQQLAMVNTACTPACADVQFAVHEP